MVINIVALMGLIDHCSISSFSFDSRAHQRSTSLLISKTLKSRNSRAIGVQGLSVVLYSIGELGAQGDGRESDCLCCA